jgi:hypothetical protein
VRTFALKARGLGFVRFDGVLATAVFVDVTRKAAASAVSSALNKPYE